MMAAAAQGEKAQEEAIVAWLGTQQGEMLALLEDLVNIGAYVPGINPEYDLAVQVRPRVIQFLQQEPDAPNSLEQSKKQLMELNAWIEQADKVLRAQAAKTTMARQPQQPAAAGAR